MFNRTALGKAIVVVLVFKVMLAAPGAQAPADPISGTWVSDGRPFLELQANADAVSGTVHFYGGPTRVSAPIDSGSFDARTGALRLTGRVAAPDGKSASYVIDGVLDQETLRVMLTIDDGRQGSQVLRRLEASPAAQAGSAGGIGGA